MLHELQCELPTSSYWDLDIINNHITQSQKTFFKLRTIEVFGDCENPLSNHKDKDYIGISYIEFDDYEVFKMLNNIYNDKNTTIRISKLDNHNKKVFTIEYSGCRIVNIKNNIKYNCNKELLDKSNTVYFDYKKRKIISL